MLQFPTNIYPQNVAFDPAVIDDKNHVSFIFNGDVLTTANFKIYNYNTGEFVEESHYATQDQTPWHYNGEEVSFVNGTLSSLVAGNDYVIQMMLTQSTVDGYKNIYDMPVVRGKVVEVPTGTITSLIIEDKINNIYEWETSNGLNVPTYRNGYLAAGMVIQIGSQRSRIDSYDRNTGEIELASALVGVSSGDSYTIYSNYLVTPQYYFMCRSTPTLQTTAAYNDFSGRINGTIEGSAIYTDNQSATRFSAIKYYDFKLYWADSDLTEDSYGWIPLRSSPKIYSQLMHWYFTKSLIGINNKNGVISDLSDIWYKVDCTIVTQDGMSVTNSDIIKIEANEDDTVFVNSKLTATIVNENMPDYISTSGRKKHQTVYLEYSFDDTPVYANYDVGVYRRNLETNEVEYLGFAYPQSFRYKFYDYTVPNKGSFEYSFVPHGVGTGRPYVNAIAKAAIDTNMCGYTITSLIPYEETYDTYLYSIGDCWKFVGEIDDVTVTQNINRVVHVGTGNYSSVSMDDVNYASGSLSAMIGAVDCGDKKYKDTIDMVKAWREFITKNSVFMLKSQKGDVWIVNIIDSPSTTYAEMENGIPTTFTFDWAECVDLKKVLIKQ